MHLESADGGLVNTENTYYDIFTCCWTSTNASDTSFSTSISFDAGFSYGSEIIFSKNVLCLPLDHGSAYAPDTPVFTRIPIDTESAYGFGIPFSTELPFTPRSCHLQITDQSTCRQHTDCDAVHMSCNGSISACTSKCASCTVWETVRCDDESVPLFSLAVGHDSLTYTQESYNSDSSSDRSQVEDQLTCSQFAASTNGSQTRNRTHGDASDVGGVLETPEGHGDDVEDETVDASCSKSGHEDNVLVFDTGLETPCVGHWIIIACIVLRWYCRPTNLEKRPRYLRTRFEFESLDTKPEVYRVSRSLRRCVALAAIRKRFRAWRIKTTIEKYDRIGHVVSVAFLLIVMFQPVAEGSAVVSVASSSTNVTQHHNDAAMVNASNIHTGINQLAALNVDPELKDFIGSLVVELRELKRENAEMKQGSMEMNKAIVELQNESVEMKNENVEGKKEYAAVGAELARVQDRTQVLEVENKAVRTELKQMKRDKAAFENKTQTLESQNAALKSIVIQLSNKTTDFEVECKAAVHEFSMIVSKPDGMQRGAQKGHRRVQNDESAGGAKTVRFFQRTFSSAGHLSGHVDESNGGHRLLIEEGIDCSSAGISRQNDAIAAVCCEGPGEDCTGGRLQSCDADCAALIVPLFTVCRAELAPAVGATLRAAVAMCPRPDIPVESTVAHLFKASCPPGYPADYCIPVCEEEVNGYLLLLNLDGEDTKLTCEVHHGLYSWVGGASDGGSIGEDHLTFISSINSGAAGTFVLRLKSSLSILSQMQIRSGQIVQLVGDRALPTPPVWGSGGFVVTEKGSLALEYISLLPRSHDDGFLLVVQVGGRLTVGNSLLLQPTAVANEWVQPVPLPCDGGLDGMCRGPHLGMVTLETTAMVSLATPLVCGFWTNDCRQTPPVGVSDELYTTGLAAGIPWNADAVCFVHGVRNDEDGGHIEVPDDPNYLVSVGQGVVNESYGMNGRHTHRPNYDPSMPSTWRCDSAVGTFNSGVQGRGPFGLNRTGGTGTSWYRLPTGKALPTVPPGPFHCGTRGTGWLAGWPAEADAQPGGQFDKPGDGSLPPPVGSPPAAGTVCFHTVGYTCAAPTRVRAVSCGAYALWELPPATTTSCFGYCLATDRCADCSAAGHCTSGSWARWTSRPAEMSVSDICSDDDAALSLVAGFNTTCAWIVTNGQCSLLSTLDPSLGYPFGPREVCGPACGFCEASGNCTCTAGWAGALCNHELPPSVVGLPAGVSHEQYDRAVASGVDPAADATCFTATFLTVLDDMNLTTAAGQGYVKVAGHNYDPSLPPQVRCDGKDGSDGGPFGLRDGTGLEWYRLPSGKGLPTAPPGRDHCGTASTGWLSGWPAERDEQPDEHYAVWGLGLLPPAVGSPPAAGTVCFDGGYGSNCWHSTTVRAVSCGAFVLWELPPGPSSVCSGYCIAGLCDGCAAAGGCDSAAMWTATGGCGVCMEGWTGELCDVGDGCRSCAATGRCTSAAWTADVGCTCVEGWTGELCDVGDACRSCAAAGHCTGAAYATESGCECIEPWGGELCDDQCSSCAVAGRCIAASWIADGHCADNNAALSTSLRQNRTCDWLAGSGLCHALQPPEAAAQVCGLSCGFCQTPSGYCACTAGWAGPQCHEDACQSCAAAGQCTDSEYAIQSGCTCVEGWAGELCDHWVLTGFGVADFIFRVRTGGDTWTDQATVASCEAMCCAEPQCIGFARPKNALNDAVAECFFDLRTYMVFDKIFGNADYHTFIRGQCR